MCSRYTIFIIFTGLIGFFCYFYAIIFCGIYINSAQGWLDGIILGFIIDWCIISIVIPLIKASLRITVRTCPILSFLVYLEYMFIISEFCG